MPTPVGEQLLSAVLNSLHEAVVTVSSDHRIVFFNKGAERLVGIPASEALGRDCREVMRASFGAAQHDCPMGDLVDGTPRADVEGTFTKADGRVVPVSASWSFFEGTDGRRDGFVIVFRDQQEIEREVERWKSRNIVGRTPAIRRLFDLVEMVKDTDSTVLITGESGTGKGLFARAIHDRSARRDKPFVKVTCAALTETLLESELFGHVRGSFTGAISDRVGRFESADGGTVFLDEISEVSPAVQVKLLRFLQEREFEKVGSGKTQTVDVRVVAATNRDLRVEMRAGRFREDLFYRLNVIEFVVPPLRDRRDDIPALCDQVMKRLRSRGLDRVRAISREAMRALIDHPWPGNVRELENVIERGLVTARGSILAVDDLPDEIRFPARGGRAATQPPPPDSHPINIGGEPPVPSGIAPSVGAVTVTSERPASPDELERDSIVRALETHRWKKTEAAAALGIDRTTLWRKMKRYALG